ncbi:MAG: hypothetical protein QNJ67_20065 [Kiloniellales bacterium]|nr:hypothetical protein [Kiloniellales bacterium]
MEKPELALSLSGGGHRATLFAAGAMLALVDRGLNTRVCQIASVSGGSITNAFVAQRCDYSRMEAGEPGKPGQFDEIVKSLVGRVVSRGIIETWMLVLIAVLPCLLVGAVLFVFNAHWAWWVLLPLLLIVPSWLTLGKLVEFLLDHLYFQDTTVTRSKVKWPCMKSIGARELEHVFCTTDLVHGQPLYVSTHNGGLIWRRTNAHSRAGRLMVDHQDWNAEELRIAEAVRASASFPGIPPKRLSFGRGSRLTRITKRYTFGGRVRPEEDDPPALRAQSVAFLSDGGLWNNLGTHVVREDHFVNFGSTKEPDILCINASATLRASSSIPYHIPIVGTVWSLLKSAQILNINTVHPRVQSMRDAQYRRKVYLKAPGAFDHLDLIADLAPVSVSLCDREHLILHRDKITHIGSTIGFVDHESFDQLKNHVNKSVGGNNWDETPTTLGRIGAEVALQILVRGYFNTFIESLFLKPFSNLDDVEYLYSAEDRIRGMVPGLESS